MVRRSRSARASSGRNWPSTQARLRPRFPAVGYEVRAVLAGAYRGKTLAARAEKDELLNHAIDAEGNEDTKSLCGRIRPADEKLVDGYGMYATDEVTCSACLARLAKKPLTKLYHGKPV